MKFSDIVVSTAAERFGNGHINVIILAFFNFYIFFSHFLKIIFLRLGSGKFLSLQEIHAKTCHGEIENYVAIIKSQIN